MDDKELIKKVRNSLIAKKSKSEILRGFQKRGYKLEYAEALLNKAKKPKKVVTVLTLLIIVSALLFATFYISFLTGQKTTLTNPLAGFTITGNTIADSNPQIPQGTQILNQNSTTEKSLEQIEITPEFISFLLQEIGASQLHSNLLEKPIINVKIEDQVFHSIIGNEIKTTEGLSEDADIQFNTNKPDLVEAIISDNPEIIFKESITSGNTQIELKTSETELFSKGYLGLYDSLR